LAGRCQAGAYCRTDAVSTALARPSSANTSPAEQESDVPKLFLNAEPGTLINDRVRALVRTWPNQTETTVPGIHYIQEDSPDQIGTAVADFVRRLRTP
jgi:hypothetical protein